MDFYTASVIWIFSAVALLAINIVDGIGLVGNIVMDVCVAIVAVGVVAYKNAYEKLVATTA